MKPYRPRRGCRIKASNKKRLYLGVYPSHIERDDERRYRWSILVGPKVEKADTIQGSKYAVVAIPSNDPTKPPGWRYEETEMSDIKRGEGLAGRILIAKIENEERLLQIFRETPVTEDGGVWSCRLWVENVLKRLMEDRDRPKGAVGTSVLNWRRLESVADKYVDKKDCELRYAIREYANLPVPTWDMLRSREMYP